MRRTNSKSSGAASASNVDAADDGGRATRQHSDPGGSRRRGDGSPAGPSKNTGRGQQRTPVSHQAAERIGSGGEGGATRKPGQENRPAWKPNGGAPAKPRPGATAAAAKPTAPTRRSTYGQRPQRQRSTEDDKEHGQQQKQPPMSYDKLIHQEVRCRPTCRVGVICRALAPSSCEGSWRAIQKRS